jgi:hypothetical protein
MDSYTRGLWAHKVTKSNEILVMVEIPTRLSICSRIADRYEDSQKSRMIGR